MQLSSRERNGTENRMEKKNKGTGVTRQERAKVKTVTKQHNKNRLNNDIDKRGDDGIKRGTEMRRGNDERECKGTSREQEKGKMRHGDRKRRREGRERWI